MQLGLEIILKMVNLKIFALVLKVHCSCSPASRQWFNLPKATICPSYFALMSMQSAIYPSRRFIALRRLRYDLLNPAMTY